MAIGDVTFYPNSIPYVGVDYTAEPTINSQNFACSGGETTGELYDLLDNKRTSVLTVDTNGENTNFNIQVDLTTNITELDFVIIDNHNLKTADAEIKFQESTPSDQNFYSSYSGTLGTALSADTIVTDDTSQIVADGITVLDVEDIPTDNQFFIVFHDIDDDNFDADVTIGEIAFGNKKTISVAPDINIISNDNQYGVTVQTSAGGQKSSFKTMDNRKSWSLTWQAINETDKTAIETVWAVTEGPRFPFYIDLGESATPQLYYVRFVQNSLRLRQLTNGVYSLTLEIESEV